jgi:tRNA threonylcarbamoyl adenosine modification protein (Sua5/YciO/YrdC/YwlC family)
VIVPIDEAFNMTLGVLRRGGVVALPTDTVYGLAALPGDATAMARVFSLKQRADAKSIAVLVADLDQARAITAADLDRFAPWWPGPLTVVVTRRPGAVLHLGGDDATVGVRCPDHPFVRRLAQELGPIAATSANLSGEPVLPSAADVAEAFPDLAIVVDGGVLDGAASTVVDATVDPPRVLREGPIRATALGLASPS